MKRTSFGDQVDRFEALLDRLEGMLRHVGVGESAPSPVLDPEYMRKAQEAADKYIEARAWELRKEAVEADLS